MGRTLFSIVSILKGFIGFTRNFETVADAKADKFLRVGQKISIDERDGAVFDVVLASSVVSNDIDYISRLPQLNPIAQALALHHEDTVNLKAMGLLNDVDASGVIERAQQLTRYIQLPSGTIYISRPIVLTTGQTLNGKGMSNTPLKVDGDYDAIQFENGADFIKISNLGIIHIDGKSSHSATSAAIRPHAANGGNNHVISNVSVLWFRHALYTEELFWNSVITNLRCNFCGTDISAFGSGQSINNTFINFYSNKPAIRALDIRAVKDWTFITPNFGGNVANGFGSYIQMGTNSFNVYMLNPNFEGEGALAYPNAQSGIELLSGSVLTLESPTFTKNKGAAGGLSYEVETRDSSTCYINNPRFISQGANMGRYKAIGNSKIILNGGDITDIDQSASSVTSYCSDNIIATGFLSQGLESNVGAGDVIDTGLNAPLTDVHAKIRWSGDARATVDVNVSDRFSNGTFKVRFTDLTTGGVASGQYDINWYAK